jgi:hypothetical protein
MNAGAGLTYRTSAVGSYKVTEFLAGDDDVTFSSVEVAVSSDEDILQEIILGEATSSVTFANLSQYASDYEHFQVRYVAGSDTINRWFSIRVNGDTGSNYTWHSLLVGGGGSVNTYGLTGKSGHLCVYQHDNLSTVGLSAGITDILDAFDTSKNTTIRTLSGMSVSPYFQLNLNSSLWANTNAVDSLTFYMADGSGAASGNLIANTRITLIGVK